MATSRWKLEDLHDLEQVGLAAELESTNLDGQQADFEAYNMSEVLTNLLKDEPQPLMSSDYMSPFGSDLPSPPLPIHEEVLSTSQESFSFILRTPTALGIKSCQEPVTYLNKGQPYEMVLQAHNGLLSGDILYKSVVMLGFSELRLRNCEQDQFEQWSKDHPMERLLEIDKVGCDGLTDIHNDEKYLNQISFLWSTMQTAILSLRVNCLSTEFAARKHGGEKGVPLQLQVDTYCMNGSTNSSELHIHRGVCSIKVFKDKGADRKHKQDQQKLEKMSSGDLANFHPSRSVTHLQQISLDSLTAPIILPTSSPTSPRHTAHCTSTISTTSGASPYYPTTPPRSSTTNQVTVTSTVQETHDWLAVNRFAPYTSLFANYTGADLLRLNRRDFMELCGAADGIRLFNALRTRTIRVIYICMGREKIYHAVCLEQLSAHELLAKVASKLGLLQADISSFLRLTPTGILVLIDDTLVENFVGEEAFLLQAVKVLSATQQLSDGSLILRPSHSRESGQYQIILQEQQASTIISAQGAMPRAS